MVWGHSIVDEFNRYVKIHFTVRVRIEVDKCASNIFGGGVATIIGSVSVLNISAVKSAALPGNGIIMNIQYEPITQTNNVWFVSQ